LNSTSPDSSDIDLTGASDESSQEGHSGAENKTEEERSDAGQEDRETSGNGENSGANRDDGNAEAEEYLRVDHLKSDFQERSVQGGIYMVVAQAAQFVLKLGSTVFLARLLTPEDFGLVAMASAITGFMMIFKDLGLSMATIQRENITHDQVTGLFWVNVGVSTFLAVVAGASAPGIAWFYGDERLVEITIALSFGFLLGGLTTQHEAILKRQMRFRVLAALEVASILVGSVVAITFAFMGGGYWSLVLLNLMRPFVLFGGVWIFCQWRPSSPHKAKDIMDLLTFGGNLTGFNVINYFSRRGDDILIGRFVGASALGLYEKAYQLLLLPLRQLNTPLTSVMIPTLSRTVDQPEKHKRIFKRTVEAITMLTMPMVAMLIMTSDWVILFILGPKWTGAASIFTLLGIVGLVQPVASATGWLFIAQNRTNEKLRWGAIGGSMTLASFVVGLPWGAEGVAASYSLSGLLLRTPLLFWYVGRRGPVTTRDLYEVLLLPGLATAGVFGSLWAFREVVPTWPLVSEVAVGTFLAIGTTLAIYAFSARARANIRVLYRQVNVITQ
jgi:PST family polysaccharide transporter